MGLEPMTLGLKIRCSNRLSYECVRMPGHLQMQQICHGFAPQWLIFTSMFLTSMVDKRTSFQKHCIATSSSVISSRLYLTHTIFLFTFSLDVINQCARNENRTRTTISGQQILSLSCLPVPPFGQLRRLKYLLPVSFVSL